MSRSDGMSYAPLYESRPVVRPGEFVFAATAAFFVILVATRSSGFSTIREAAPGGVAQQGGELRQPGLPGAGGFR